jgi:hypothetical protein
MINKGDPINPKNLTDLITGKFSQILSSITTFIPLGFNSLYQTTGTKSFLIRPKVENPVYDTRSGSIQYDYLADENQGKIGAAYYGTPWTQQLAINFGISNNFDYSLGSQKEPFIKYSNKLLVNPVTDILGGVPFRGNSPFINNGYLGMSNSFEDKNIRLYVDTEGTNLNIKASQISVMSRGTSYTVEANQYDADYDVLASESDRFNLETITLNNIDLTLDSSALSFPDKDYTVYLEYDPSVGSSSLNVTDTSNLVKGSSYPIINDPSTWINTKYYRPLFLIRSDENSRFTTSTINAWEETESGTNGNNIYTKLYQQSSSPDTTETISTIDIDRRAVPAWFYLDNDNNFCVSKTNYSGLIRHIPGAGASKVIIKRLEYPVTNDVTGNNEVPVQIKVGSCELTDGTTSLWVKDIDISSTNYVLTYNTSGIPYKKGYYLWLLANPKSIGDSGTSSNTNLSLKVLASESPTWESINGNYGAKTYGTDIHNGYTHRCRIGYLPPFYRTGYTTGSSEPFVAYDGEYFFPNLSWYSAVTNQHNTIATGSRNVSYDVLDFNTFKSIPQYGISEAGTCGTSLTCKELLVMNVLSTGTKVTSGTGIAAGVIPGVYSLPIVARLGIRTDAGKKTTLIQHERIPLMENDILKYTGTGYDGGSTVNYRWVSSWLKGFYLPFDYR